MTASAQAPSGPRFGPARTPAEQTSYEDWLGVMEALARGDSLAFAKVNRLITGYLIRYRSRALADDACDDVRQDALLALSQSVQQGTLRDPKAFVAYAGAMVRNMLLVRTRTEKRSVALAHRVREVRAISGAPPCERELALRLDLECALRALPERQRLVVDALYVRGLRYAEAARELGMPLGTLKGLQVQGLVGLRRAIGVGEHDA
jgi:RNA polymerase sigma-70 factor (ECF subfamily)